MQSTHSWLGVEVSQSHPHPQSQSLDNKSDETDFPRIVSVESRASYKSRTIETGNSFLEGLELPQTTYVDNSKSIYYKNEFGCDRYEQEVGALPANSWSGTHLSFFILCRFMTMTMSLMLRRSDSLRVRSGLTCSRGSARGQGSR